LTISARNILPDTSEKGRKFLFQIYLIEMSELTTVPH